MFCRQPSARVLTGQWNVNGSTAAGAQVYSCLNGERMAGITVSSHYGGFDWLQVRPAVT